MVFNGFRFQVGLRVVLLVLCVSVAVWGWIAAGWLVTPVVAGALAFLCAAELVWYVERSQREFSAFLGSILHQDYSLPVPAQGRGRSFDDLDGVYRSLSEEFKRLNLQKAANYQYLEAVVEHIAVALICLDRDGNVVMMNEHARRLFGLPHAHGLRSIARFDERLPALLERMRHGDRDLLQVRRGDEVMQLVLYATEFSLLEKHYKLVSFQNIRDELERREIESWQKLIRVLTHEIMNSVTPIISLSKLVQDELVSKGADDDLLRSVNAVHSRSSGLLDFVKAYRSFATVPVPKMETVDVLTILQRVRVLMDEFIASRRITMQIEAPDGGIAVHLDPRQLEQILINLVRNAAEALADLAQPLITLRATRDERQRVVIQVIDNGVGIDPVHLDNIFVPFFTTKRGGNGVGLSISRQLVQANRGFITAKAAEPRGSVFTMLFPPVTEVA
jgi:nitrogen fixation/metabolism regulation signal transduction histidine kinase